MRSRPPVGKGIAQEAETRGKDSGAGAKEDRAAATSTTKPAKHKAKNKHKTKPKTDAAKGSEQSTVADSGATTSSAAK